MTEDQKQAVEELNDAIDEMPPLTRLRCQTPQIKKVKGKEIAYFQHMDYDERVPPTEREASLMCKTAGRMCPVAAQCLKAGLATEAGLGVWGGRVLIDGKDYYNTEEETNGNSNR